MKELFEDTLTQQGDQQYLEWLALNMFAITAATQAAIQDAALRKKLLDSFHILTYQKAVSNDRQRVALETLLQQRYDAYFATQKDPIDPVRRLGVTFSNNFCGRDDLRVQYAGAMLASKMMITTVDFLKKIHNDFDLV